MHTYQRIWRYFQQHRKASIVAAHLTVLVMIGMLVFGGLAGTRIFGAFAQSPCGSNHAYRVVSGDTLSAIADRYHTTWQKLASFNRIRNANLIYVDQIVCIPGSHGRSGGGGGGGGSAARGHGNFFPYGQCTWWASQRYYQMHGIYVPWTINSDAWEWTARAYDYHWNVSTRPSVGAIVDLQPWVQGAYGAGHVAVVERVLSNGNVIASNMNWGAQYWKVVYVEFHPGPGVTFLSF